MTYEIRNNLIVSSGADSPLMIDYRPIGPDDDIPYVMRVDGFLDDFWVKREFLENLRDGIDRLLELEP